MTEGVANVGEKRNPFNRNLQSQQRGPRKLVGAYIPLPLANRLRLLSVYYGKSLQGILEELISEWDKATDKSEKEIIDALVERAVMEWQRRMMESGTLSRQEQEDYIRELQSVLQRRKVSKYHVDIILDKLKRKVGAIE